MRYLKEERKIVAYSLFAGLCLWVIDAVIESLAKSDTKFIATLITDIPLSELVERSLLVIFCVVFGVALAHFLNKRKRLEKEREGLIRAVSDATNGIGIADASDRFIYVNDAYARIFGSTAGAIRGKSCSELMPGDNGAGCFGDIHRALRDSAIGVFDGEITIPRPDGSAVQVELKAKAFRDDGEYQGFICVMNDISERKQAEDGLTRSLRFLNTIFDSIRDPFVILDRDFRIVRVNQAYAELKGHIPSNLMDQYCYRATKSMAVPCENCVVQKTFASGDPCAKEKMGILDDGSEEWFQIFTYPITDDRGAVTHVIEYVRNITDQKRSERERDQFIKKLGVLSSTDELTGLMNRRIVLDRLQSEIDRSRRYSSTFSVLFCDLDNFKEINDSCGHQVGDEVLRKAAAIMKAALRNSDIVGRYGGDEFLVVLPETSIPGAEEVAERIRQNVFSAQLEVDGESLKLSVSIGVTLCCASDHTSDELISRIDNAMYVSKKSGKNRVYTIR